MPAKQQPLDSNKVLEFARKTRSFTTDGVARRFGVRRQQAAASIAILRIKEVVKPDDPAKDTNGSSRWVWTG